jgi:hypothetical protein
MTGLSHTAADSQKRTGPHEGARWFSMPLWGTATSSRGEHAGADARSGRTTASASRASYAAEAAMSQCTPSHNCHAAKFRYGRSADLQVVKMRGAREAPKNASVARSRRGSRGRPECAQRI